MAAVVTLTRPKNPRRDLIAAVMDAPIDPVIKGGAVLLINMVPTSEINRISDAALTMINAFQEGGREAAEKIIRDNPDLSPFALEALEAVKDGDEKRLSAALEKGKVPGGLSRVILHYAAKAKDGDGQSRTQ